jgi:hypothetical protein
MPKETEVLADIGREMFDSAKASFGAGFAPVEHLLRAESDKLAITLQMIARGAMRGEVSPEEAAILLGQQKVAAASVLTAAKGISIVAAQAAVSAGLATVRQRVNTELGFSLL